jgi:hypothetical protein
MGLVQVAYSLRGRDQDGCLCPSHLLTGQDDLLPPRCAEPARRRL